jgi:hypothetical protein
MGEQYDDLKLRIDQINQARRHLGQSVDASGHVLRRVLHRAGGAPPRLHAEGPEPNEQWPRPPSLASRSYSGVAVIVVVSVVALLAAFVERRWPVSQARVADVSAEISGSRQPVSLDRAFTNNSFVVHVRATRPCRVRVVADGTALDWHALQEGDEFLSSPRQEILIESDDAGALAATVNGRPIYLGPDRQALALRLTSEDLRRLTTPQ